MQIHPPRRIEQSKGSSPGKINARYVMGISDDRGMSLEGASVVLMDESHRFEVARGIVDEKGEFVFDISFDVRRFIRNRVLVALVGGEQPSRVEVELDLNDSEIQEVLNGTKKRALVATSRRDTGIVDPRSGRKFSWYPKQVPFDALSSAEVERIIKDLGFFPEQVYRDSLDLHLHLRMDAALAQVAGDGRLIPGFGEDFVFPVGRNELDALAHEYGILRDNFIVKPSLELQDQRILRHGGLSQFLRLIVGSKGSFIKISPELRRVIEADDSTYPLRSVALDEIDMIARQIRHVDAGTTVAEVERRFRKNFGRLVGRIAPEGEVRLVPVPLPKHMPGIGHASDEAMSRNMPISLDLPSYVLHILSAFRRRSRGQNALTVHGDDWRPVFLNASDDVGRIVKSTPITDRGRNYFVLDLVDSATAVSVATTAERFIVEAKRQNALQARERRLLEDSRAKAERRRQRNEALAHIADFAGKAVVGLALLYAMEAQRKAELEEQKKRKQLQG